MTTTAIEDPDDDDPVRRALELTAEDYRARLAGTLPANLIEEAVADAMDRMSRYTLSDLTGEDTRPEGYGRLNETYKWVTTEVPGVGTVVRAKCIADDQLMTFTLKVDPRYGRTQNKHTRGKQAVVYNGRPVQSWECTTCKQWVVQ